MIPEKEARHPARFLFSSVFKKTPPIPLNFVQSSTTIRIEFLSGKGYNK